MSLAHPSSRPQRQKNQPPHLKLVDVRQLSLDLSESEPIEIVQPEKVASVKPVNAIDLDMIELHVDLGEHTHPNLRKRVLDVLISAFPGVKIETDLSVAYQVYVLRQSAILLFANLEILNVRGYLDKEKITLFPGSPDNAYASIGH